MGNGFSPPREKQRTSRRRCCSPYLGVPGENCAHLFTCYWEQVLGTLDILEFRLAGMHLGGQSVLLLGRKRQVLAEDHPEEHASLPLSASTERRLQTGGRGRFAPRDGPAATAQGMMSRVGVLATPLLPINRGRQRASSQLPSPSAKMDLVRAAKWAQITQIGGYTLSRLAVLTQGSAFRASFPRPPLPSSQQEADGALNPPLLRLAAKRKSPSWNCSPGGRANPSPGAPWSP